MTSVARSGRRAAGAAPLALRLLASLAQQRFFAVLVLLVGLVATFSFTQERFFTSANIEALLTSAAILWVVSIGLTFVMLAGGFDLSVGSMLALTSIGLGAFVNDMGLPVIAAVLVTLAFGALLGAFNGILVGRLGLSFLVVTLGTLILYRGIVNLWSERRTEQVLSSFLDALAFDSFLRIPYPVWLMAATFVVALYVQRSTYFGRDVYAVGGNPAAARLSGVRVGRTIIAVYAISGLLAGVAGVLQTARIGASSPLVGEGVLFDAAAAVLLGGTSFAGGIGGVGGTAVAVLFLATLQNGLSVAGIASYWQQILTGAILVGAILLDRIQRGGGRRLLDRPRRTGHEDEPPATERGDT